MKSLSVFVFCFQVMMFEGVAQQVYSVEACFDSHFGGSYCFVDMEGTTYEFQDMERNAQEKFDLTGMGYQGRTFIVVYRIETTINKEKNEEDDDWEKYQEYIILDLELVG